MLRLAVPRGSLEEETFKLFSQANLPIRRNSERDYRLSLIDPRISEVFMLRPQEIPKYIEEGEFDIGITGLDWVVETESAVKRVVALPFSKSGLGKVKIVLATDINNPVNKPEDIDPGARVVTEYPRITRRFFKGLDKGRVSIRLSYGVTEIKVPRLADYLVDVTETGETLARNNKKILATIMESSTVLIANIDSWKDPVKKEAIKELSSLLIGVLEARDKTLIKMNISRSMAGSLVKNIPSLRPPTISPFYLKEDDAEEEWVMIETVVKSSELNIVIPRLKDLGAKDILEIDISKMIP